MRCTILLFAQLAELAGTDRLHVDLVPGATVADALEQLAAERPVLEPALDHVAVAVDEHYRHRDTLLREGATVALIPPVSGG